MHAAVSRTDSHAGGRRSRGRAGTNRTQRVVRPRPTAMRPAWGRTNRRFGRAATSVFGPVASAKTPVRQGVSRTGRTIRTDRRGERLRVKESLTRKSAAGELRDCRFVSSRDRETGRSGDRSVSGAASANDSSAGDRLLRLPPRAGQGGLSQTGRFVQTDWQGCKNRRSSLCDDRSITALRDRSAQAVAP